MRTSKSLLLSILFVKECTGFGVVPELATQFAPAAQNLFHSAVQSYQHALQTDALKTQVETGIALAVVGDAIAQNTQTKEPYNANRAASFAAFDACYRAVQHDIYPPMIAVCNGSFLANFLPNHQEYAAAIEQALVSQIVIIPVAYYPVFFAVTGAVQGLTLKETLSRAKETFWPLMKRNWLFWIPVQFAVFGFVPDENAQISILIACGLVWTIILSALAGSATPKERFNEPVENILTTMPEEEMQRSFGAGYTEALETPEGPASKQTVKNNRPYKRTNTFTSRFSG